MTNNQEPTTASPSSVGQTLSPFLSSFVPMRPIRGLTLRLFNRSALCVSQSSVGQTTKNRIPKFRIRGPPRFKFAHRPSIGVRVRIVKTGTLAIDGRCLGLF